MILKAPEWSILDPKRYIMVTFDWVFLIIMTFFTGGAIGIWLGIDISKEHAVKAGHAKYNEITRKFEWKEIDKKED